MTCPLCGWDAQRERHDGRDAIFIECQLCGRFVVSGTLLKMMELFQESDKQLLPYLSAHTRQATERGETVELHSESWKDLALAHSATPVSIKLARVLEWIAAQSRHPGSQVVIDERTIYPLFDAATDEEAWFLVEHLVERGYLKPLGDQRVCIVTADGWARLEAPVGGTPGRCFIAMAFDSSLDEAYERGIKAAVADCGLTPVRVDRIHHNEKICDKILAEIRRAQLLVADFTLQRAGVYFEAGFAMGLGRPVIWACHKNDLRALHFDTRQYNHIEWETPAQLRERLADRIRATLVPAR